MRIIIMIISLFTIVGCNNTDTGQENDREQNQYADHMHYETEHEKNERLGIDDHPLKDYYQSDERGIATDGTEQNIFDSDEAREIAQKLALREDVKQAQVATTDDQVAVFVLLHDYQDPKIAKSLEKDIKMISPNKDIFVYTDKTHWNRVKDLESSMRARQIGNDLQKYLEDNFNIKIKD